VYILTGISLIEYGFHPESIKELKEREVSNCFNILINRFDNTGGKVIISRPRNLLSNPLLFWNVLRLLRYTVLVGFRLELERHL
jgi:hypothetical protein